MEPKDNEYNVTYDDYMREKEIQDREYRAEQRRLKAIYAKTYTRDNTTLEDVYQCYIQHGEAEARARYAHLWPELDYTSTPDLVRPAQLEEKEEIVKPLPEGEPLSPIENMFFTFLFFFAIFIACFACYGLYKYLMYLAQPYKVLSLRIFAPLWLIKRSIYVRTRNPTPTRNPHRPGHRQPGRRV